MHRNVEKRSADDFFESLDKLVDKLRDYSDDPGIHEILSRYDSSRNRWVNTIRKVEMELDGNRNKSSK